MKVETLSSVNKTVSCYKKRERTKVTSALKKRNRSYDQKYTRKGWIRIKMIL